MATEAQFAAALPRLKVFPLPQGVLLPGSGLPLHVFEPRYRALVEEALESDRVLAIARLAPGWEKEYDGRPQLLPMAGAGFIEESEKLGDGRYNILVRGVARVRIRGEHSPDKLFREVQAETVAEIPAQDGSTVESVRRAVLGVSTALSPEMAQLLTLAAARLRDPGTLCDVVAAALLDDADVLQGVLEALDVQARARRVLGEIGALMLAAQPPAPAMRQ